MSSKKLPCSPPPEESSAIGYSQASVSGGPISGDILYQVAAPFRNCRPSPGDFDFAGTAGDLQREQVLPLGPARMQKCHGAARRFQQQEAVVLHRHLPEESAHGPRARVNSPRNQRERSIRCTPGRSTAPAARYLRIRAPLAFRSRHARHARSAPEGLHQRAERAGIENLASLAEGTVKAVIEADLYIDARSLFAATRARSSELLRAAGFSTRTCLPNSTLAKAMGASQSLVVATTTASTAGRAIRLSPFCGCDRTRYLGCKRQSPIELHIRCCDYGVLNLQSAQSLLAN